MGVASIDFTRAALRIKALPSQRGLGLPPAWEDSRPLHWGLLSVSRMPEICSVYLGAIRLL